MEGSAQGTAASGEIGSTTFLYDVKKQSALTLTLEKCFPITFYGSYVDNIFLSYPTFYAGTLLSRMRGLAKSTW